MTRDFKIKCLFDFQTLSVTLSLCGTKTNWNKEKIKRRGFFFAYLYSNMNLWLLKYLKVLKTKNCAREKINAINN